MPHGAFLQAARDTRHDLERLVDLFGASVQQVAKGPPPGGRLRANANARDVLPYLIRD